MGVVARLPLLGARQVGSGLLALEAGGHPPCLRALPGHQLIVQPPLLAGQLLTRADQGKHTQEKQQKWLSE